jgi:hypothetical protein
MISITVLQTHDEPIHLELNPDLLTRDMNQELSKRTGIDAGKIMLFNEQGVIVNKHPYTPLSKTLYRSVNAIHNNTLQLLITEHTHPTYIKKPQTIHYPPPLFRINKAFESITYDNIPAHIHPEQHFEALRYFANKRLIYDDYYSKFPKGIKYLEQIRQSLENWELNHHHQHPQLS